MTIPSRPAPPPPSSSSTSSSTSSGSFAGNNNNHSITATRYTPTTNWDDKPFNGSNCINNSKKMLPPPRPPPPKINALPALKKPGSQHSVNILSNLFGVKRSKTPPNNGKMMMSSNGRNSRYKFPPKVSLIYILFVFDLI